MIRYKIVDFSSESIPEMIRKILLDNFRDIEECDSPDFLFYSAFGYEHLKYKCVRIFWTGENMIPDFNICDYAIGFAYLNFGDRYRRIPLYHFYRVDYMRAKSKHEAISADMADRRFCNFVYSNGGNADPLREKFFRELSMYRQVDSGGRYLNNIGGPIENKLDFQRKYKFSIAFENSAAPGYTTEKLVQAFAAQTVPIYWGDPQVSAVFNDGSFINVADYASIRDVITAIEIIDNDADKYLKMLETPMEREDSKYKTDFSDFEEFIVYICSQRPEKAYRRSLYGWNMINEDNRLKEIMLLNSYKVMSVKEGFLKRTIRRIVAIIKRVFRRK